MHMEGSQAQTLTPPPPTHGVAKMFRRPGPHLAPIWCRRGQKVCFWHMVGSKILLPSALHRLRGLTVSESVSQSGQQSVRQSVGQAGRQTETHSLGFFSVADLASSSWENTYCRMRSGLVVKQPTADLQVDGSNPSPPIAAPAPTKAGRPGIEPLTSKSAVGCTTIGRLLILAALALLPTA